MPIILVTTLLLLLSSCSQADGSAVDENRSVAIASALTETPDGAAAEIDADACVRGPSILKISASPSGPVSLGTTIHYDITVQDNDVGPCPEAFYSMAGLSNPSVVINGAVGQFGSPGVTLTFGVDISSTSGSDPGPYEIPFRMQRTDLAGTENLPGKFVFELAAPPGCYVSTRGELLITATGVVDDPVRTFGNGTAVVEDTDERTRGRDESRGAFSFGHLMRQIAPTRKDAPALVERLFSTWLTDQVVNSFVVHARPAVQERILDLWPRTPTGELDLDRAPIQLLAIANRIDLRDLSRHSAGEGRFVFAVTDASGAGQAFTIILEYNLPARCEADVVDWARDWHALTARPFGSEEYKQALERITRRFTRRDASPGGVNGSALLRLRTDDLLLSATEARWELRQFALSPTTGFFEPAPLSETPDLSFRGTITFADYVNQNETAIIAKLPGSAPDIAPLEFEGRPFLGGAVFNDFPRGTTWFAPGINSSLAAFQASLNTCTGCHSPVNTRTSFTQISPRARGEESTRSPFLNGTTVITNDGPRFLGDLGRRKADLLGLVCAPTGDAGAP